jgi:nucleolar protein 56
VQTVGSIDDLNKTANLLFERLSEWYGIYFPELRLSDQKKYLKAILSIDRKNASADALREALGESAEIISQKAKTSMGADLTPADIEEIRSMAKMILSLYELRDGIEAYQEKLAAEICPNISHIAGAALAAKLVAEAGGLQRLAQLPASTVQVIGAEKALFKHLRTGSKPPKHGVIFQHALISMSPKNVRGKIARALATKIAIGAKADAYTKHFIAEKLKAQFDARAKAVLGKIVKQ